MVSSSTTSSFDSRRLQVSRAKAIYADKFDDYLGKQCLKEFLLPPDVARMALFLTADDSRMITGQTFVVDGDVV